MNEKLQNQNREMEAIKKVCGEIYDFQIYRGMQTSIIFKAILQKKSIVD